MKRKHLLIIGIIIFLLIVVLLNFARKLDVNNSTIITEESFQKAITKTIDPINALTKIDTEKDTITILASNTTINYNFNKNAQFDIELNFNNKMSKEECVNEFKKFYGLIGVFPAVTDHFSISEQDSSYYIANKIATNKKIELATSKSYNFTNAIQYAKDIFDGGININDTVFNISSKKVKETSESYKAKIILTVDLSSNFAVMNGTYASDTSILDAAQNALDQYKEQNKGEENINFDDLLSDYGETLKNENQLNSNTSLYDNREKKDIEETIENYYKLLTAKENSPILMLTDVLKLTVEEVQDPEYAPANYIEHPNSSKYMWTGIKYDDFSNKLWYISDSILKSKFSEFVEYKDYLYIENNDNNSYLFKYNVTKQEIDYNNSKEDTCICNVTVKNSKTKKETTNKITMSRGNGDFVITKVQ